MACRLRPAPSFLFQAVVGATAQLPDITTMLVAPTTHSVSMPPAQFRLASLGRLLTAPLLPSRPPVYSDTPDVEVERVVVVVWNRAFAIGIVGGAQVFAQNRSQVLSTRARAT